MIPLIDLGNIFGSGSESAKDEAKGCLMFLGMIIGCIMIATTLSWLIGECVKMYLGIK